MIGVDLGKRSFQLHDVRGDGSAAFKKKVSRERFLAEVSGHRPRIVAMEACGGAHHRGRELQSMGFEVRPVPPIYVKPFVKRHKNDAADALRGHLAEHGVVAPQGIANVARLAAEIDDPESRPPAAGGGSRSGPASARTDRQSRREDRGAGRGGTQAGEGERRSEAPDEHSGNWADLRDGDPGLRAADGGIPLRARLLGLARFGSPPMLDKGKAEARPNLEDGAVRPPAAARCWGDRGHPMGVEARNRRSLAGRAADQETADAGHAGEQDGAGRLGRRDEEGILQGPRVRLRDGRRSGPRERMRK